MGKYLVMAFLFVVAISVPSRADTTQCITASVPPNNVTVGFDISVNCSGSGNNLRIIRDIHLYQPGATETACDFPSELPPGWVITGFITGSDCSRTAQPSGVEFYTIANLNGLPVEATAEVCYQSNVPSGWVVVNTSENGANCGGGLGTHRGFANVNGEPTNEVETICSPTSPIPPGWVAGSPMTDPGQCGGTAVVQITNTNPLITFASLQANGNFAILAQPNNTPQWSNGQGGTSTTDLLVMQGDGNLVEYTETWTTGTTRTPNGFHLSTGCLPSRLLMGQTLFPGQCMASDSGRFVLSMQTQGNLVLYDSTPNPSPWTVVWVVPGNPMGNNYAVMQTAGNFVLYRHNSNGTNTPLWATTSSSPGPGFVWLQDDGNLNVYTAIWNTGTYPQPPGSPVLSAPCSVGEMLSTASGANSTLNAGQCILSNNSRFELSMQSSGNLILYDLSQNPAKQLWSAP